MLSAAAVALLAGSSWTLATLALRRKWRTRLRAVGLVALRMAAGLGLTALRLSLAALAGVFSIATQALAVLTCIGVVMAALDVRDRRGPPATQGVAPAWTRALYAVILIAAGVATIGAAAPVTDDDALAYVVPIARQIAKTGAVHVWPDQARSMWPQSQQVLAFVLHVGGDRLGVVTALEWWLCIGVISALARRGRDSAEHVGPALVAAAAIAWAFIQYRERRLTSAAASRYAPPRRAESGTR